MAWEVENQAVNLFRKTAPENKIGGFFLTKVLTKWPKNQKGLQAETCNPLIILVRLAGIEPTTPWFVAKYSIQLSYSREKQNYSITLCWNGSPFLRCGQYFLRREEFHIDRAEDRYRRGRTDGVSSRAGVYLTEANRDCFTKHL